MQTLRDRILSTARKFVKSLPGDVGGQTAESVSYNYQLGDGEGMLFLSREQAHNFIDCAEMLRGLVAPYFDGKFVLSALEHAVLLATEPHREQKTPFRERLTTALDNLASVLIEPPSHWDVHFGVHNISHQGLPQTVGRVTFMALNNAGVERILTGNQQVSRISPDSPETKEFIRDRALKLLTKDNIPVAAHIAVRANTSIAASAMGLRELRRTLDVLNFYADLVHVQPTLIYLPGEAAKASQFAISYRRELTPDGQQISEDAVEGNYGGSIAGIWSALGLFDPYLQEARERGFDCACALLNKDLRTPVEERILTALHWAGRAAGDNAIKHYYQEELDSERQGSFTSYAICFESLLGKRGDSNNITQRLSCRCAQLLAKNEDDYKYIKGRMTKLYDRRSKIVHEGHFIVGKDELRDIRKFAVNSIIKMLTNEEFIQMNSGSEFEAWFEEKEEDLDGTVGSASSK